MEKLNKQISKSFTLIEILVVIVVIGILSAFILVGMSSITASANIAKSKVFLNSMDNSLLLGRVSQWKLDEGSGTSANDSPTWINSGCVSEKCLSFDGTDSITVPNSTSLGALDANVSSYSISVWVKSSDPGSSRIMEKGNSPYPISFQCSSTTAAAYIYDGTNNPGVDFGNAWNGNWRNLIFVVNYSTDKLYGYLDSILLTPVTNTVTSTTASAQVLYIGNRSGSDRVFNGQIDDVRIYNQAIPTSEIQNNFFIGINRLYKNNGIALEEYNQRLSQLRFSLAKD